MKILGIDPGLQKTGWGVIRAQNDEIAFVSSGHICTNLKQSLADKLVTLHHELEKVVTQYQPDEIAIEETFVNINPLSSLKLGQARGSLILTASLAGFTPFEYSATAVKKAITGVGRAEKRQVGVMIKYLLPSSNCCTEDEADALAVAICHSHSRQWLR